MRPIRIVMAVVVVALAATWGAWLTGLAVGDPRWSRLGTLAFAVALAAAALPPAATLVDRAVEKLRRDRRR